MILFKKWEPLEIGKPSPKFMDAITDAISFDKLMSEGVTCFLGEASLGGIVAVNEWVNNTITYEYDAYDNWQNPSDTILKSTGDCEDYALLKRALLIERGFNDNELMMVVGFDMIIRQEHAILLVLYDKEWWVLDNRTNALTQDDIYTDFNPIKGYSASNSWIFGEKK